MTSAQQTLPQPQQRRSRETLRKILDAFEQALSTKTFEEVTVGELCQSAGCSVGTFYGRVESKEALLNHLRDRVYADGITMLEPVFAPADVDPPRFEQALRGQLGAVVDFHIQRLGVIRAVIVQARRNKPFAEHAKALNRRLLKLFARAWLSYRARIDHDDPTRAVREAALMTAGYLRECIIFADLWPPMVRVDKETTTDNLHRMVLGYLTGNKQ